MSTVTESPVGSSLVYRIGDFFPCLVAIIFLVVVAGGEMVKTIRSSNFLVYQVLLQVFHRSVLLWSTVNRVLLLSLIRFDLDLEFMDFGPGRKRGRSDAAFNGNGGPRRSKQEMESFPTGIGSKSKPCTKFFSTSGCPFGEGCHFLHYVPGGINAVAQMTNLGGSPALPPSSRNPVGPPHIPDGSSPPAVKTRLCNKFNSAEGCKFGDKCHFAHGEWELGKAFAPSHEDPRIMGPMTGRLSGRLEPPPPGVGAASSFGASATAKISVDASLAGAIIGKAGVNSKQICRITGAKLAIREHESDPNLKNIELEGTFDQIKQASAMVRELIVNIGSTPGPMKNPTGAAPPAPASNFKTKLCENFAKGLCTFGERCHFAHGASDLRKSGM